MVMFRLLLFALLVHAFSGAVAQDSPYGSYIEADFPFLSSSVEARALGDGFPTDNLTVRGLVFPLGHHTYVCFDTDMLRLSVGWTGEFLSLGNVRMRSYHTPHVKAKGGQEELARVLGQPIFANGLYPGIATTPRFDDPRSPAPNVKELGRGPLPKSLGVWQGISLAGDSAILSYALGESAIREHLTCEKQGDALAVGRTFEIKGEEPVTIMLDDLVDPATMRRDGNTMTVTTKNGTRSYGYFGRDQIDLVEERYVVYRTEPGLSKVLLGSVTQAFLANSPPPMMPVDHEGGSSRWPEPVVSHGKVAPDSKPFVLDDLESPWPNPWKRRPRLADIAFFSDGRAALVSVDGDVWILSGIGATLSHLQWKRFASGLHGPVSLCIREDEIFVNTRSGIVHLSDTNGDGEADLYKNFCNLFSQTAETREFPLDMVKDRAGNFYLAKPGQQNSLIGKDNGRILKVSADGKTVTTVSSGHRQPYLGMHPENDTLTSTDQQGHYVPSTPIRVIAGGEYFGYVDGGPQPEPEISLPLCWIPHPINRSAAGQVWLINAKMGELTDSLIHLGFNPPALYKVYWDEECTPQQGGVVPLEIEGLDIPLLQGEINPVDGLLYLVGFNVWGTSTTRLEGLMRLRPGSGQSNLPTKILSEKRGIILTFDQPLASAPPRIGDFLAKRWNYQRSADYGSGYYKLDGSPGQEHLGISSVVLSQDRKALLIIIPDMKPAMQFTLDYAYTTNNGLEMKNAAYLTIHELRDLNLLALGFSETDLQTESTTTLTSDSPTQEASIAFGKATSELYGCVVCHAVDDKTVDGKKGPSWKDLHGSERSLISGDMVTADDDYLRESILDPTKKVAKGFDDVETGMPPYRGILTDVQINSILLYIKTL